jgi:hypothetical protein
MDCGKPYRGRRQRERKVYICSGYSKGESDCSRFAIKEEDLTDIITKHFNSGIVNLEEINSIEVKGNRISINYTDGTQSILSPTQYTV